MAVEIVANLMAGKLNVLEDVVSAAVEKRTGEPITQLQLDCVRDNLKAIQFIGWDSTFGCPVNIHGYTKMSDTLCDISEVLNYQMGHDEIHPYLDSKYPMHWNDDSPLIRVIRVRESEQSRKKQLIIFPHEK